MVRQIFLLGILFVIGFSQAFAVDPIKNGVYLLECPDHSSGTCFVVKQDGNLVYLATAFHVLQDGNSPVQRGVFASYTIKNDQNTLVYQKVLSADVDADIAILSASTGYQHEVLPLYLDPIPAIDGTYVPSIAPPRITFEGFAYRNWKKTTGNLVHNHAHKVYSDAVVIPGQSGGIATIDGKCAGVISGGLLWLPAELGKKGQSVTWPARIGSSHRIKEILDHVSK